MELKEGYKITEVGLIPEDWEIKELVTLGYFQKGKGIKKDEVLDSGLPCVRYGELYTTYNNIIRDTISYIPQNVANESFKLNFGDLLFAGSGETKEEIGKSAVILREDTYAGGDIVVFRAKNIDYEYLGYISNVEEVTKQKSLHGQGDAVVHIYSNGLAKVKIPLPPTLTEQKVIATVLSDTDALILALEKKIAKKKLIKKGVMQKLLSPKEGWEEVKLSDVIDVSRGGSPRPIQDYLTNSPDGINWIKIGDTSPTSKYINSANEKIIQEGKKNSREVKVGDFLLSNSMSFGRPYILKIDGCIHDGWLVLQNYHDNFDTEFLYYTLTSEYVFNQYLSKAAGSGVLNLNKELVSSIKLIRPSSITEQTSIAKILSDIDKEIEQLEQNLTKFNLIKQGMMQQLLTGKIRLVKPNSKAKEEDLAIAAEPNESYQRK